MTAGQIARRRRLFRRRGGNGHSGGPRRLLVLLGGLLASLVILGSSSDLPMASAWRRATSSMVRSSPEPMLMAWPTVKVPRTLRLNSCDPVAVSV